jgi:hypothetical protein
VMQGFTIYKNPSDYPGRYVLRRWEWGLHTGGQPKPDQDPTYVGESLENARANVPEGLICVCRAPADDPVIIETWLWFHEITRSVREGSTMSKTIVDMPKVSQMLDAGWKVYLFKNQMGSYLATARHPKKEMLERIGQKLIDAFNAANEGNENALVYDPEWDWKGDYLITDDFTPEQALTRLAYKVHGEILIDRSWTNQRSFPVMDDTRAEKQNTGDPEVIAFPQLPAEEEVFTPEETAEILKMSKLGFDDPVKTLQVWVWKGSIGCTHVGRKVVFTREHIRAYLSRKKTSEDAAPLKPRRRRRAGKPPEGPPCWKHP